MSENLEVILQNIIDVAADGGYDNRVSRKITMEQALNIYRRGQEIEEESDDRNNTN